MDDLGDLELSLGDDYTKQLESNVIKLPSPRTVSEGTAASRLIPELHNFNDSLTSDRATAVDTLQSIPTNDTFKAPSALAIYNGVYGASPSHSSLDGRGTSSSAVYHPISSKISLGQASIPFMPPITPERPKEWSSLPTRTRVYASQHRLLSHAHEHSRRPPSPTTPSSIRADRPTTVQDAWHIANEQEPIADSHSECTSKGEEKDNRHRDDGAWRGTEWDARTMREARRGKDTREKIAESERGPDMSRTSRNHHLSGAATDTARTHTAPSPWVGWSGAAALAPAGAGRAMLEDVARDTAGAMVGLACSGACTEELRLQREEHRARVRHLLQSNQLLRGEICRLTALGRDSVRVRVINALRESVGELRSVLGVFRERCERMGVGHATMGEWVRLGLVRASGGERRRRGAEEISSVTADMERARAILGVPAGTRRGDRSGGDQDRSRESQRGSERERERERESVVPGGISRTASAAGRRGGARTAVDRPTTSSSSSSSSGGSRQSLSRNLTEDSRVVIMDLSQRVASAEEALCASEARVREQEKIIKSHYHLLQDALGQAQELSATREELRASEEERARLSADMDVLQGALAERTAQYEACAVMLHQTQLLAEARMPLEASTEAGASRSGVRAGGERGKSKAPPQSSTAAPPLTSAIADDARVPGKEVKALLATSRSVCAALETHVSELRAALVESERRSQELQQRQREREQVWEREREELLAQVQQLQRDLRVKERESRDRDIVEREHEREREDERARHAWAETVRAEAVDERGGWGPWLGSTNGAIGRSPRDIHTLAASPMRAPLQSSRTHPQTSDLVLPLPPQSARGNGAVGVPTTTITVTHSHASAHTALPPALAASVRHDAAGPAYGVDWHSPTLASDTSFPTAFEVPLESPSAASSTRNQVTATPLPISTTPQPLSVTSSTQAMAYPLAQAANSFDGTTHPYTPAHIAPELPSSALTSPSSFTSHAFKPQSGAASHATVESLVPPRTASPAHVLPGVRVSAHALADAPTAPVSVKPQLHDGAPRKTDSAAGVDALPPHTRAPSPALPPVSSAVARLQPSSSPHTVPSTPSTSVASPAPTLLSTSAPASAVQAAATGTLSAPSPSPSPLSSRPLVKGASAAVGVSAVPASLDASVGMTTTSGANAGTTKELDMDLDDNLDSNLDDELDDDLDLDLDL